jgi:phosphoribosylformylglycinamidine cyclo-ligase
VLAIASSGLHSNGFSLVRKVIELAGWKLDRDVPEFGRTLGEELLVPTRVYAADLLSLAQDKAAEIHAYSHITGGGLAANLARVLPVGLSATVDRSTWIVPAVFDVVRGLGGVPWTDLEATLNLGVGMVAVTGAGGVDAALRHLAACGLPAWVLGTIGADDGAEGAHIVRGTKGVHGGAVRMTGAYRTV